MTEKLRVDKWLWSIRIFKSRTMSTDFCKSGKVRLKEEVLKPSSLIQVGQTLEIKKNGFNLLFKVIKLISKRVSASEAILCYENVTPESEMNKFNEWFVGKSTGEWRDRGEGRPTKKERRLIDEFKSEQFNWDDEPII
ncbi:MAG: RNA-binding S4 domain-containing protein [Saprospiraceae bacterium]|nr:RNA-binding S4 domain-containing protein [Saprospiraceae bacterium]